MAPGSWSRAPSLRRQSQPVNSLPVIIEDAADPPILPEKSARRTRPASTPIMPSQYGSLGRSNSTRSSTTVNERPPYSTVGGPTPDHLKSKALRRLDSETQGIMDRMARRGGWYKLILASILVVGIVIGLAVGLTVGLRKRNGPPPPPLPTDLFPAGSYGFTTALANITTGCLPNTVPTDTWNCSPGSIHNSSAPDLSSTTYLWTIEPVSRSEYVISSSLINNNQPNQPIFTNLSLALLDANQPTERLTFSFTISKSVPIDTKPGNSSSRTPNTTKTPQITCFFNATTMKATIWTRTRATYPVNITNLPTPINASRTSFSPWPFKVQVREVQKKVGVIPDCRDGDGRSVAVPGLGKVRRQEIVEDGNGDDERGCSCLYANYGVGAGLDLGEGVGGGGLLAKNVTRGQGEGVVGRRRGFG